MLSPRKENKWYEMDILAFGNPASDATVLDYSLDVIFH